MDDLRIQKLYQLELELENLDINQRLEVAYLGNAAEKRRVLLSLRQVDFICTAEGSERKERTSGMTPDNSFKAEDPAPEELRGWAPELIDDGDGPYYLFTPHDHRVWMARAKELISYWEREGDNADQEVSRALWVTMHVHNEGFDADGFEIGEGDAHLEDQANARASERWNLSLNKINPILRAVELIGRLPGSSGRLRDAWVRRNALRYLDIKFNSAVPEEREERHNLGLTLGLEDPDAPAPC